MFSGNFFIFPIDSRRPVVGPNGWEPYAFQIHNLTFELK